MAWARLLYRDASRADEARLGLDGETVQATALTAPGYDAERSTPSSSERVATVCLGLVLCTPARPSCSAA